MRRAADETRDFSRSADRARRPVEVDADTAKAQTKLTGVQTQLRRLDGKTARANVRVGGTQGASREASNLFRIITSLGPATVPVAATMTAAFAGAAASIGALAAGAGTAVLAFQGVGDALDAMNDAELEPTEANMEDLRLAMEQLSPAAQEFSRHLFSLRPALAELRTSAAGGLLPGLQAGLNELMEIFPQVEQLVSNTAFALGDLAQRAGDALNDPFWQGYVSFIANDAGPTLQTFGRIVGNLAEGFAGMLMAFDPLADDFGRALERMASAFSEWGRSLSGSQGFRDFVAYVRQVGPQVGDTLLSLAEAIGAVVEAAAPVGPIVLGGIRLLADTLAFIADIPSVGPALIAVASGLAAISTAIRLYDVAKHSRITGMITGVGAEGVRASHGLARFGRALGALAITVGAVDMVFSKGADEIQRYIELIETRAGAAGGGIDAQIDALSAALQRQQAIIDDAALTWEVWGRVISLTSDDAADAGDVARALRERIAELEHQKELDRLASDRAAVGHDNLTGAMRETKTAVELLSNKVNTLGRDYLDLDDKTLNFKQTLQDLTEGIKDNTLSGLDQRGMLQDLVGSTKDIVGWHIEHGSSLEKVNSVAGRHRRQLMRVMEQMGFTEEEAKELIDRYNLTPEDIETTWHAHTSDARRQVRDYRRFTNEQLNAISDEDVKISFGGRLVNAPSGPQIFAAGGPVQGPGTETSDSIPARLSRGEHVWTAREVRGAGGHDAVEQLRAMVRGYARGGPVTDPASVNFNVDTSSAQLNKLLAANPPTIELAGPPVGGTGATGSNQALGRAMAAAMFGWTGHQWAALRQLWINESGWNELAHNPSSGAHGIPQSLPWTKMLSEGADAWSNPATQIRWGLKYIRSRYGTPAAAWSFWNSRFPHWYDNGFGVLPPGATTAVNGTGQNEYVFSEEKLARMMSARPVVLQVNASNANGLERTFLSWLQGATRENPGVSFQFVGT